MSDAASPEAKRRCLDSPAAAGHEAGALLLGLELALPFLQAGELYNLAVTSKTFRAAALASFHKRRTAPHVLEEALIAKDGQTLETIKPIFFGNPASTDSSDDESDDEEEDEDAKYKVVPVPLHFRKENPWCCLRDTEHNEADFHHQHDGSVMFYDLDWPDAMPRAEILDKRTDTWKLKWWSAEMMEWREHALERPKHLTMGVRYTHYSRREDSLLVLVAKSLFASANADPIDDSPSSYELWGLLYDLKTKQKDGSSQPSWAKKVLDTTIGSKCSIFGDASRSHNGLVLAVVTETPYDDGNPAEVTVLDISDDGFQKRCSIQIPHFEYNDYGSTKFAFSTRGEILSILHAGKYASGGNWSVYDIRQPTPLKLLEVEGFSARCGIHTYFTPDNDFVMYLPNADVHEAVPEVKKMKFPCFARQIICYIKYE